MTNWINKLKSLLIAFLGTDDGKYVVTHDGKKILLWDRSWVNAAKFSTTYTNTAKATTAWTIKVKA